MEYAVVDGPAAEPLADQVWAVYDAVFGDVAHRQTWEEQTFRRHLARADFRMAVAREASAMVGFGYGYTGNRGEYWPDRVVEALGDEVADEWVGGHFELVELAVLPEARNGGVGGRLHDLLLDGLRQDRALLSTDAEESPAVRLYRRRGWARIGMLQDDVQVMGKRLR